MKLTPIHGLVLALFKVKICENLRKKHITFKLHGNDKIFCYIALIWSIIFRKNLAPNFLAHYNRSLGLECLKCYLFYRDIMDKFF